jgi:hypothetical protein
MWSWWQSWLRFVRGLRIGHPKHYVCVVTSGTYALTGQSAVLTYVPAIDNTPNQFTFTDQTNVALSSTITSAAVTISGLGTGVSITLNASGGTIDLNGNGVFLGSQIIQNGDTVRARVTSSSSGSTAVNCVVVASPSGIQDTFTATTLVASASSFDFYISTTGSDSNPGTLASPWAITSLTRNTVNANNVANFNATAGKRIGLLPGTYLIGPMMHNNSNGGALQIIGGSSGSPTYLGSSDSSGHYSARTATISALNAGVYGGFAGHSYNGPMLAHTGTATGSISYATNYITIDGIVFTGFSYKAVRIGAASSGDGPGSVLGVTVKNCEFTGNGHAVGDATDNTDCLWLDNTISALVTNNYFHDNRGTDGSSSMDHMDGVICWGCRGTVIQFNTLVNSGTIYGKEDANQGTTVQNNYIDVSMYTASSTAAGIQDFTGAPTGSLTQTTIFRYNVVLSSGWGIRGATLSNNYGWTTPVEIYNNTFVLTTAAVTPYPTAWVTSQGSANLKFYNNLYTGAADASGYKSFRTNPGAPSVWDYNLYPSTGMTWALSANATLSSTLGTYTTRATFASAIASNGGISGADANGVAANDPVFTGIGSLADAYKLGTGSPALNAGKTGGTSGGSTRNIGAWDGTQTQIGCNLAVAV